MTFEKLNLRSEAKPQLYSTQWSQSPACWNEKMSRLFTEYCSVMGFGPFSNLSKAIYVMGSKTERGKEALELILCLLDLKLYNCAYLLYHIISALFLYHSWFKGNTKRCKLHWSIAFFTHSIPGSTSLQEKPALLLCLINVTAMIYFHQTPITSLFCQIHSLWSRSNFSRYTRRTFFHLFFDIFANMSDMQYMQIEPL